MYKRHSSAASTTSSQTDRLYDCLREEQHKSSKIAAKHFIETTLGSRLASDDFHKELQDGVLLCRLINCLRPGTIKSIGKKNIPFVKMANIGLFLQGARELGLHNSELFQTVDLYEAKDMGAVINTILSLARLKSNGRRRSSDTPTTKDHDKRHQYPQRTSPQLSNRDASLKSSGLGNRRPAGLPSKKSERQLYGTHGTEKSDSRNGYRHVKSIFGQQLSAEEANKTCRANDVGRISEKAEALRRTYRSNLHQRPTADSGYSTMALRGDDEWQYPDMPETFEESKSSSTSTGRGDDNTDIQEQRRETPRLSTNSEASSSSNSSGAYSAHMEQHVPIHRNSKHYLDLSKNEYDEVDSFFARPAATRSTPIVYTKQETSSQEDVRANRKSITRPKLESSESTPLEDTKKKELITVILEQENGRDTHYQLGNCIGKGQFGSVYRALDVHTGEIVAVKRIRVEDVSHDQEIMQEVDLLKNINSRHIVRYLGSVRDESYLNIVLEYVENGSLLSTLKAFGSLPEKLVASYVHKILCGLKYLHEHEVAHCDLKAANILTTKTGEIKLTDFGVSLNLRIKQDELGAPAGTPNWMAPEVIELKGASTKSDIWSLGCTIVEMLTGKPPYAEMIAMSALYHIVEDECPPLPSNISKNLEDFLRSCFRKDPAARPTANSLLSHPWIMHTLSSNASPPLSPTSSLASSPTSNWPKTDYGDIDLTRIFEYVRSNPTMDSQRVPASEIRRKEFVEHQFVKTSFGKAVTCKVCLITVKRHAAYCEACALICHDKCRKSAASCRPIYPNVTTRLHPPPRRDSYPISTSPAPTTHGNNSKFQKMLASCMKKPNQDQLSSEYTKSCLSGDTALSVPFIDQSTTFRRRSTGTFVDIHLLPATDPKPYHRLDKKRTKSTHQDECVIS